MGKKRVFAMTNMVLAVAGTFLLMRETHSCEWLINNLICGAAYKGKEALLREFFVLVSLFLLAHSAAVMTIRIVTARSSPATQPDPKFVNVLNQIMRNTIEQVFIFSGLYLYLLYEKAGDRFSETQLGMFVVWFLVGRVLFSLTYLLGAAVNMQFLRSWGMALGFQVIFVLVDAIAFKGRFLVPLIFGK